MPKQSQKAVIDRILFILHNMIGVKTTLAQRLDYLFTNLGIKQQDFAQKIDFTQSYVSQIVNGSKTKPSPRFYEAVSRVFNVNIKWLIEGTGKVYAVPGVKAVASNVELLAKYQLLPPSEQRMVDEIINAFLVKTMTGKDKKK